MDDNTQAHAPEDTQDTQENHQPERFRIVATGRLGVTDNLTRAGHVREGVIELVGNRQTQSRPDPETLETRTTTYGWVVLSKEDLLRQSIPLARAEQDVVQWLPKDEDDDRTHSLESTVPAFSGRLRTSHIRELLKDKDLAKHVLTGEKIRVELVQRHSRRHDENAEKFPEDTIFYPTGRFETEAGERLVPGS